MPTAFYIGYISVSLHVEQTNKQNENKDNSCLAVVLGSSALPAGMRAQALCRAVFPVIVSFSYNKLHI